MSKHSNSPPKIDILQALNADHIENTGDPLAEVVAACKTGDRDAYRRLYDLCHRKVYRLTMRIVGEQNAADVTQEVFLKVFRKLDQFTGRAHFQTWLYRLATNESIQYLRRSRRWTSHGIEEETRDKSPSHEVRSENREVLDLALQRLEPELRCVFLLREVEQLSYRDIALVFDVPGGTVGSRLNRARRKLQCHLRGLLHS